MLSHKLYNIVTKVSPLKKSLDVLRDTVSLRQSRRRGHFSQHSEDLFLIEYFGARAGRYLDVGANHPFRISNTYLLYTKGWSGVVIEPIEEHCRLHRKYRPRDTQMPIAVGPQRGRLNFFELVPSVLSTFDESEAQKHIANGCTLRSTREIDVVTLADVFEMHSTMAPWDLLSVDTEGLDFQVLSSNDWSRYRPTLVLFEAAAAGQTASDSLLERMGYRKIRSFGCNRIYESQPTQ